MDENGRRKCDPNKQNLDKIERRTFFLHGKMGANQQDDKSIGQIWTKKSLVQSKNKHGQNWTTYVFVAWKNAADQQDDKSIGRNWTKRLLQLDELDEKSLHFQIFPKQVPIMTGCI